MSSTNNRQAIEAALKAAATGDLRTSAHALLASLGYTSNKTLDLPAQPQAFAQEIETLLGGSRQFNAEAVCLADWKSVAFLFQLTNDELPSLAAGQTSFFTNTGVQPWQIESFVFLAVELKAGNWSRTRLARITREVNRLFPMPVILLYRHPGHDLEPLLSLAVINRRGHKRDATRDVIDGKISIVKDIDPGAPHAAHIRILESMALHQVGEKFAPSSFNDLYKAWMEALDVKALNEKFYKELADWYYWALQRQTGVCFPLGQPLDDSNDPATQGRPSVALIRLLTRLIFVWFLKEKKLVPGGLFEEKTLANLLRTPPNQQPREGNYYKAVLQNLFFATLNTETAAEDEDGNKQRVWREESGPKRLDKYLIHTVYRYKREFQDADAALALFQKVPFLNGGLFECLDKLVTEEDIKRDSALADLVVQEGRQTVLRVDGFSERTENPLYVPNELFFSDGKEGVDLNDIYQTKNRKYKPRGLLKIFESYKFTIEENTPVEEEVALDPELLGKVFENLLASYNPDTKTTARKKSGSFYTPREVVDYMVDEALVAYFERALSPLPQAGEGPGVRADAPPLPTPPAKLPDDIRAYARELRASQTDAESLLWHLLRNRRLLNLKFRRQHPVERYILDFYCDELKLAIELDGSQHMDQADYDQARSEFLAKRGIRVLRFWNNQALGETEAVLEAIYQAVVELQTASPDQAASLDQMPSPPAPLPLAGEGGRARLRQLLSYRHPGHDFTPEETQQLIQAIERLRVLDPACGSGAFPMGILQKLVHVLRKLDSDPPNALWKAQNRTPLEQQLALAKQLPDPNLREDQINQAQAALDKFDQDFADPDYADYARKLYLIEKCLYGVDIQPVAVQIAKLRFFVSLVVEQKLDQARGKLTPLPNLETKIVAANTLLPIPRTHRQGDLFANPAVAAKEAELREANASHFAAKRFSDKRKRKARILRLRDELVALLKADHMLRDPDDADRMAAWDPFDQNRHADFFDPEWMYGFSQGFDVVIGNPPYVRQEAIKDDKPRLKPHYDCYSGTADLYVYFYERSFQLLNPHGVLSFITSNKWFRAKYGEGLRRYMVSHTEMRQIIDFGDEAVFDALAYPTIVIASKRPQPVALNEVRNEVLALNWDSAHPAHVVEHFPEVFATEHFSVPQSELKTGGWQLEPPTQRQLLERLRKAGQPLGDIARSDIYRGITTGFNDAFIVDRETRDQLIANSPDSESLFEPYLRGRDINRWSPKVSDLYLIRIESSENVPHSWSNKPADIAEKEFSNEHPSIYSRFLHYRNELVGRYDQGHYFWELRACKYWGNFSLSKILSTKISLQPTFALDTSGSVVANTAYFINILAGDEYLLAILNSSISNYYAQNTFVQKQGGYYEVQPDALKGFCIPSCELSNRTLLISIMGAVSQEIAKPEYERLLNGLVYELFFPEDLHAKGIRLFDACAQAGIPDWPTPPAETDTSPTAQQARAQFTQRASATAAEIFQPSHPIYGMLFELQAVEVVRIIEGVA